MQAGEVRAIGAVAGDGLARTGRVVGDVHRAVAGRTFEAIGLIALPVRLMHDAISGAVYGSLRFTMRAVPRAIAAPFWAAVPPSARPLGDAPPGNIALGALNGAFGDSLARRHRDLSLELTIRREGRDVVTDSPGLAAAFPDATPKLAVFLHGLCETDLAWRLGGRPYGSGLREDHGYTPLYVRYNTGLHVSDNGRRLSEVLSHLVAGWPVEVEQIALIGHSMGGLVARSACHYGHAESSAWTPCVRHVFCLGAPHLGAPLERMANAAGWGLGRLPETRPFGDLLNSRSAGIKDLRYGSCVEEDWCDCDPDEYLRDRCNEVPFLDCATYCFVGATLARDPDSLLGRLVGDLLVQYPSASGQGKSRRIPFELDNGCHVGSAHHLQLLNHPAVYEQLSLWLSRPPIPRLELPAA